MLVRGVGGAEVLQPAGGLTRWLGVQVPGHVQSAEQPCLDPRVEADVVGSQPAGMVVGTGGVLVAAGGIEAFPERDGHGHRRLGTARPRQRLAQVIQGAGHPSGGLRSAQFDQHLHLDGRINHQVERGIEQLDGACWCGPSHGVGGGTTQHVHRPRLADG